MLAEMESSSVNPSTAPSRMEKSIAAVFFAQARRHPHKPAIHCEGVTLSYAELASWAMRWSQAMARAGVQRGDCIGVALPNSLPFVTLMLVAADLGAALVPIHTSLSAEASLKAFQATDVQHIVAPVTFFEQWVAEGLSLEGFKGTLLAIEDDWLRGIRPAEDIASSQAVPEQVCSLARLLANGHSDEGPLGWGQPEDAYILTMTSGSTGEPKPIVLTQRTKLNRAQAAQTLYRITQDDITLAATPLYHSLAERLVLIPLLTGGTSVLMSLYSPSEWVNAVKRYRVTFTIAVSSQLKQIAQQLTQENTPNLDSLRCIVSSSALLETDIKARLIQTLKCDFHECYGASEIAIATNLNGQNSHKLQSVGVAAPTVDIKILDANDQPVAAGEVGEIVCKTSMLFGGYYKRPELTQAAMWGEYFRTGDIGTLDHEGYLYYLGRKKDVIISGGINIYPMDIESVVLQHPQVIECAAFSYPDENLGEVVAVAVVANNPNQFELKRAKYLCAKRLADYQQPRKWFLVETIPKNSLGKVMKFQLVKQFRPS